MVIQGLWSPTIALVDHWELSDNTWRQPKDMGACGRKGHSVYYWAPIVDAMPDAHVAELIAHELVHVFQHARGEIPFTAGIDHNDRSQPRWANDHEMWADEIMEWWDFDPWAMDEWCAANWTRTD